ncbi:hypothetical protein CH063_15063 [Colletotrichum higginsianum]|uniref:Uncharacterized protein n=1 Tax=Colletotrichum higginsianum (strain IMI 349063) TaxID=759273 RepID=H1W186_COLHI|nr:hypothetical protein CH063_15063 [Colletotrichum higginsianum]
MTSSRISLIHYYTSQTSYSTSQTNPTDAIFPCLNDPLPLRLVKRGKVLGRHTKLHRLRLPGLQPDLVKRHEYLDRCVRRPLRLPGVDLHHGPAGDGPRIGHIHRDLKLVRHVGFPGDPEAGVVKGRVREAVAEREVHHLLSDPVVVPVPDEHALGVLDPELAPGVPLAGEVPVRRRVLDARREADGQLSLRAHGAREHVGDGVAALLAG